MQKEAQSHQLPVGHLLVSIPVFDHSFSQPETHDMMDPG